MRALKMTESTKCPACQSDIIHKFKLMDSFPAIVFPVSGEQKQIIESKQLESLICEYCNHIFQINIDLPFIEKIYNTYYENYPFSDIECFVEHYRKPFEETISFVLENKRGNSALEIGVSSSNQLKYLQQLGLDAIGITPEDIQDELVINSFYEDHQFEKKFAYIVSRFNLEHITDLELFMQKLRSDLVDDGLFIVQVPNIEFFISQNILNFCAHEHIHYFNKTSLSMLLQRHGFVVDIIRYDDSPSIIAVARKTKDKAPNFTNHKDNMSIICDQLLELFSKHNGRIVIYGASLSLTEILYSKQFDSIDSEKFVIVDDNPVVHGLYMPNYANKIISYDELVLKANDIVLLTLNATYHQTVLKKIKDDGTLAYTYCIDRNGLHKA
jgi:hypothetical protein